MAESLAHRWGQIVGDVLEAATLPLLEAFARQNKLYLDKKGLRPARPGKKATWIDINKNKHDLDYVLERNGSPSVIGQPVAFIETAWRRYTKHSRNKAQEIQGAILPLVAAHQNSAPFVGAILAGVFTKGALEQLQSLNFSVLFFPYAGVVEAFRRIGLDAAFDETTREDEFRAKIDAWERTTPKQRKTIADSLIQIHQNSVNEFMDKLCRSISRSIEAVLILPLHGESQTLTSVEDAIKFIENYDETGLKKPIVHYLIEIRYSNGDKVEGKFSDKNTAIQFLRSYQPPPIKPATKKAT